MGMFTTIVHPEPGNSDLQIKTGDDECETFRVGDRIPWAASQWNVNSHIDGIYEGIANPYSSDCWVVIKDCTVVAIEPRTSCQVSSADDEDGESFDTSILWDKYGLAAPDPGLWTEEQHAYHDEMRRDVKADLDKRFAEARARMPADVPDYVVAMGAMLSRRMDYASIGRSTFLVQEFPPIVFPDTSSWGGTGSENRGRDYQPSVRQTFLVDELPESALPVYDKDGNREKDA